MIGPVFAGAIHDLTQSFAAALVITSATLILTVAILMVGVSEKQVVQT